MINTTQSPKQEPSGFSGWIRQWKDELDLFIKIFGVIGGLVGGAWGLWQYISEANVRSYEQAQKAWATIESRLHHASCEDVSPSAGLGFTLPLEILAKTNAPIDGIRLHCVELGRIDLSNARLTNAIIERSNLTMGKLNNANLHSAILENTTLTGAEFTGAMIASAIFKGAWLNYAVFTGAKFRDDIGREARFDGACLDLTGLPPGAPFEHLMPLGLPEEFRSKVKPCPR